MKCIYSTNDIALYVEGDLSPEKICDIEAHLANCPACRALAGDLSESQAAFKSLRRETVSAAALSSVRTHVMAELSARRFRMTWGRWVYAVAGAVFVLVLGIALAHRRADPVLQMVQTEPSASPAQPVITSEPDIQTPATKTVVAKVEVRRRAVSTRKAKELQTLEVTAPAEPPVEPPKQLVVKLLTDDPNIVIYWLVDQKGGGAL
jgi:anti-sigma factor RsiW